jgi:1,4-alpha-glucan branching enzyme
VSPAPSALSVVLHSHLPWVLHHGRWPHGSDWLCEAVAESYLPLWRVLDERSRAGASPGVTLGLTPVLCEQLAHPDFVREFRAWLEMKRAAAREDQARFATERHPLEQEQARRWERFFRESLEDFFGPAGTNVVARFRSLEERGALEIISCAATHAYLPLLGTPASVERQVALARRVHHRHFGRDPSGFWLPECAYRPAGPWASPLGHDRDEPWRAGLEEVLGARGFRYFFVDRHLIAGGRPLNVYAEHDDPLRLADGDTPEWTPTGIAPLGAFTVGHSGVACMGRDEATAQQVWSREVGYPGDPAYLEFHKRRDPGGLRYWRVTHASADLADKALYDASAAARRTPEHAAHFLDAVSATLAGADSRGRQICAMYDTELFGHWWFEGPQFLAAVLDAAAERGLPLATARDVLARAGTRGRLSLPEGSWGAGGLHRVWLQPETLPYWREVHAAEVRFEVLLALPRIREPLLDRLIAQAGRELMLLESSDWPFLITTGAARDYAEARIRGHAEDAARLMTLAERRTAGGPLTDREVALLLECEQRDSLFPDILAGLEAAGAGDSFAKAATRIA